MNFSQSPIFAIDDIYTTEVDDGISYERDAKGNEWVHVHIADPTNYMKAHSAFDEAV